jgi:hypothetical protein
MARIRPAASSTRDKPPPSLQPQPPPQQSASAKWKRAHYIVAVSNLRIRTRPELDAELETRAHMSTYFEAAETERILKQQLLELSHDRDTYEEILRKISTRVDEQVTANPSVWTKVKAAIDAKIANHQALVEEEAAAMQPRRPSPSLP